MNMLNIYETNSHVGYNQQQQQQQQHDTDGTSSTVAMSDGWYSFGDLDNFDSAKLLRALTLKEEHINRTSKSIWEPCVPQKESAANTGLPISSLRQLEALFNLSQLLFGLSRAETVNYTFRDLQLRKCPHSFKKSGFTMLQTEGRVDFYSVFEQLVNDIVTGGGLEVTLIIYKNPVLPMVRQKCLDLISNLTTVPTVASHIMKYQSWFLDHLLIMVRDGDIIADKIPGLSVLIRLLKVMLLDRVSYSKLIDMQYIDCIVDICENPKYTEPYYVPFFIQFEFISMQSLTVILGHDQYCYSWSDKAKVRLLNYCVIVLLKAAGALTDQNDTINHIYYAEQHMSKHSLAHTIMTVTELLRYDDNMRFFYRHHKPFKQLIVQLIEKYGAKSKYIRIDPGISYALNHLMRVLYMRSTNPMFNVVAADNNNVNNAKKNSLKLWTARLCSNPACGNEETKYKMFKECPICMKVAYCSRKCSKSNAQNHKRVCSAPPKATESNSEKKFAFDTNKLIKQSSSSPQILIKRNRRTIDSFAQAQQPQAQQQQQQQQRHNDVSQSGYKNETFTYSKAKKLSKFSSMNDNAHRPHQMPLRATIQLPTLMKINKQQDQDQEHQQQQQQPTQQTIKSRFTKYTSGSFKENKILRNITAVAQNQLAYRRHSVIVNQQPQQQQHVDDASIQFARPLKTSTAVCLTNLNCISENGSTNNTNNNQVEQADLQTGVKKMKLNHRESLTTKRCAVDSIVTRNPHDTAADDRDVHTKRRHSCAISNPSNLDNCEYFDMPKSNQNNPKVPVKPIKNDSAQVQQRNKYLYHGDPTTHDPKLYSSSLSMDEDDDGIVNLNDSAMSSSSSTSSSSSSMLIDSKGGSSSESSSSKPKPTQTTAKSTFLLDVNERDEDDIVSKCLLVLKPDSIQKPTSQTPDDSDDNPDADENDDHFEEEEEEYNDDDEEERESRRKVMKAFNKTINFLNAAATTTTATSVDGHCMDNFTCVTQVMNDKAYLSLATLHYEDVYEDNDCKTTDKIGKPLPKESIDDLTVAVRDPDAKRHSKTLDSIIKQASRPTSKMNLVEANLKAPVPKEKRAVCGNLINDDDLSLFEQKKNHLFKSETSEDYNSFKKPLMVQNKNDVSINSNCLTTVAYKNMKQKHESTPIVECNESMQQARRKILQNQIDELNSTTVRLQPSKQPATTATMATTSLTNKVYSTTTMNLNKQQYAIKQQHLKQIQSLNYICENNVQKVKTSQQPPYRYTTQLNMSQYAALTNASNTASVVPISQTDLPENLKKSLKSDLKKKKSCIIQ